MNTKNKQRAKLALAELEKELEILSKEEMNACKGGRDYISTISGYVVGFSTGIYIPPYYSGSTGFLGGSGTDDDPYLLSEVVVTGNRGGGGRSSSNFGGSIHYTGGGWGNSYNEPTYGPAYSPANDYPHLGSNYENSFYGPHPYTGGGHSPSTPSSYDKFSITMIDYINVLGVGVSKMTVQSPIDAKTGFWDYKIETELSTGISQGKSRLVIELMSATRGDIDFKSNPKANSLAELFNNTGKITTFSASALLKYTRVYAYNSSGKLMWSSNAFGGGVITEGGAMSNSDKIRFEATAMSQTDSIIRAVFDNTIPGWQEYLEGRSISQDSIQKIKANPNLWRLIESMKSEK